MAEFNCLLAVTVVLIVVAGAAMADPDPLRDFCVADPVSPCKSVGNVTASDFVFTGMATPGNPDDDPLGISINFAQVDQWPALHTLGISVLRFTLAKGGMVTLHTHPRATEMIYVIQGTLYAGFIATDNTLYDGVLEAGNAVVIPRGLVHFALNVGNGTVDATATFNSENPGTQLIPNTLFGTSDISNVVLAKGFGITENTVKSLKAQFKAKFGNS